MCQLYYIHFDSLIGLLLMSCEKYLIHVHLNDETIYEISVTLKHHNKSTNGIRIESCHSDGKEVLTYIPRDHIFKFIKNF